MNTSIFSLFCFFIWLVLLNLITCLIYLFFNNNLAIFSNAANHIICEAFIYKALTIFGKIYLFF